MNADLDDGSYTSGDPAATSRAKLPQIAVAFWIMKISATTLGETAGDLLSMTLEVGYAVSSVLLGSAFLLSLAAQLRSRKYRPALYWTVILTTSTAGTTISDYMDRTLGLGYATGAGILVLLLLTVLVVWRATTGTLSVEHVNSRRAELFYWVAILVSNTLGTAFGDFLADDSGFGFLGGALLVGCLLLAILLLKWFTGVSRLALFWLAFVLTRPFGATLGDVLTKPVVSGGLGFGTVGSSAILGAVLVVLVAWVSVRDGTGAEA